MMASSSRRNRGVRYPIFLQGIESVFKTWTALKLAVDHGQGGNKGKDIAAWMIKAVEDYFYLNDDLIGSEVAEFLGVLMNQELDTIVEDNSLEELGDKLCLYFKMCQDKKETELASILEKVNNEQSQAASSAASSSKALATENDSSDESESDERMETN